MTKRTIKSPKGLLTNETESLAWDDPRNPFRIEADGTIKGPDSQKETKTYLEFWRKWARNMIKADGGDPAQYAELARRGELNRTRAAARLLVHLDRIDLSLARIGREEADRLAPIHQALLLTATYVHQLTVIDNEIGIDMWIQSVEGARRGGKNKAESNRERNVRMAEEFKRRVNLGLKRSPTAIKVEIGAAEHLSRSAAIAAIDSGLREIESGIRGKPNG